MYFIFVTRSVLFFTAKMCIRDRLYPCRIYKIHTNYINYIFLTLIYIFTSNKQAKMFPFLVHIQKTKHKRKEKKIRELSLIC